MTGVLSRLVNLLHRRDIADRRRIIRAACGPGGPSQVLITPRDSKVSAPRSECGSRFDVSWKVRYAGLDETGLPDLRRLNFPEGRGNPA